MRDYSRKVNDETDLDLRAILASIGNNAHVVALFVVLGTVISVLIAITSPAKYLASTKIVYQSSPQTSGNFAALASLAGVSMSTSGSNASAYLSDILLSHRLLNEIINKKWRLSLDTANSNSGIQLEDLWKVKVDSTIFGWKELKRQRLVGQLLDGNYIKFTQDKKTDVYTLSTEFEDPLLAYDVNIFLFHALNDALVGKMNFKATANRKFIEIRLKQIKNELARSENALLAYRLNNRLRNNPEDELTDSRLQRNVIMNTQIMTELQKQYEMAKIDEARDLPVLDIIDDPYMPVLKSKPNRKKIVTIGFLSSIILGSLAALAFGKVKKRNGIIS